MTPGGGPAIWLLALQQDGEGGNGLSFFRSDDEAQSFQLMAPIQPDWSERDEADLLPVGDDIALTWSYEGPTLEGSTRHDVYFQWWRYDATARTFHPSPAVLVFDSTSSTTAYSRAEIARDSAGRIWIQAFRLESDGSSSAAIAVSIDDGATFRALADLDHLSNRGGGRLLSLGSRVVFVYAMHDGFQGTHFRIHRDVDPPESWQPVTLAFSEGIYHGAALSAVAAPGGGMHLAYKDENDERLYYRFFDGAAFGPRTQLDDSSDWALQPAVTLVGDQLFIFYNHMYGAADYDFRYRILQGGALTSPVVVATEQDWKGYPAAAETLSDALGLVPSMFGETPTAADNGVVTEVMVPHSVVPAGSDAGAPDSGATIPDAGAPIPDAGSHVADAGSGATDAGPAQAAGPLFSDDFNRTGSDSAALGTNWQVQGLWYTQNKAITDLDGTDLALEKVAACGDCQVSASVVTFGVQHAGLVLRAATTSGGNRYQLDLLANGHVQLQRVVGGTTTVLADAPSGVNDLSSWVNLMLQATGVAPVQLSASVNGHVVASVTDSSASAPASGHAGFFTANAGVPFDDFLLTGLATTTVGGSDGGAADAGVPDAGPVDAGLVDAGVPDAGPIDAGAIDAGVPDGGPADAGAVDAGAPDAGTVTSPDAGTTSGPLFTDNFNRTGSDSAALGASWIAQGLWYTQNDAITDLDGADLAVEKVATCRDCQVQARLVGFGVPHTAIFLRSTTTSAAARYQLDLLGNGHVQIQRVVGNSVTVLADVASGLTDLGSFATLTLSASGVGPVSLSASVNGRVVVTATDSSTSALAGAGYAGLYSVNAGVAFDDFALSGIGAASGGTDGGTAAPDAGSGAPDAGPVATDAGSGGLSLSVSYTDTTRRILAVDGSGTIYATDLSGGSTILASTDGRSWTARGGDDGAYFTQLAALGTGTLLADVIRAGVHHVARSSNGGTSWTEVLSLGNYRTLTPHSWAELDGEVFLIEYQDFSNANTTLRLWASGDDGRTWSVRSTSTTHRHGHGLAADPARHALWVFFGDTDSQSGIYRSTDHGQSWTLVLGAQPGDVVDATVLADGSLLFGQDISYLPPTPHIATLSPTGAYAELTALSGPSYSIHALRSGGYVVGAEREPGGDIYAANEVSAHLYLSADGRSWQRALDYPRLSSSENARADVYFELPNGDLILQVENIQGFGVDGKGFQILHVGR